jgi:hypothetical protein
MININSKLQHWLARGCLSNVVRWGNVWDRGTRFAAKHGDWELVAEQRELPGGWLPSQREEPEGFRPCRFEWNSD